MENNPKIDGKRVSWDSQIRKGNPSKNAETREPELIEIGSDEKTKESNMYEAEKQQMEEPNKKSTRKQEKFSSSGSETQEKEKGKTGSINCLCLYNTYEPDMVKCIDCGEFSHAICYQVRISEKFKCMICLVKNGETSRNSDINNYYKKQHHSYKEKQQFVFKLNRKRVLKSVLNQEYAACQPGVELSTEFLKLRFGFSSSYSARITLDLVKNQFVNFFDGFSFNAERIMKELGLLDEEEIEGLQRETDTAKFELGAVYNTESRNDNKPRKKEVSEKQQRKRSPSNEDLNLNKRRKQSLPETSGRTSRYSNISGNSSKTDDKSHDNEESEEMQRGKYSSNGKLPLEKMGKERISENYRSTSRNSNRSSDSNIEPSRRSLSQVSSYTTSKEWEEKNNRSSKYSEQEDDYNKEEIDENLGTEDQENSHDSALSPKINKDRESQKYQIRFTWPTRFMNSESINKEKDIPTSVADFGKRTTKPIYGQIVDKNEPRQNNDGKKWNLHFILGMDGELVQFWVFGSETEVKELNKKLEPEEYYLFWGEYNIKEKYSSKFKSTNDWAVYLNVNCSKFDRVKRSRQYLSGEDSKSEEREVFAEKFQPAPKTGKKILRKKKEHNARHKVHLDKTQPKITKFGVSRKISSSSSSKSDEEYRLSLRISDNTEVEKLSSGN